MSTERFDAIVVGSGQGGNPLAKFMADEGQRVALVERSSEMIGGTCVNIGCTPSKTLIASARVAYLARRSEDFGIFTGAEVRAEMPTVMARRRAIVEKSRAGSRRGLDEHKVITILGEASFLGSKDGVHQLRVRCADGSERVIEAARAFLDTGGRPALPKLAGLDTVPYLDSTGALDLQELPSHLIVLGGGTIALELGQMYHRFGAKVSVLQRDPHLFEREDGEICECMESILKEDGVEVYLQAEAVSVSGKAGDVTVRVKQPEGEKELRGSHLLVAIGRVPNVESLNLAAVGVAQNEHGYVQVNDRLETNVPGIWALGDLHGGAQFTHTSYDDFRILRENLFHNGDRKVSDRTTIYTVFTDPELGRVGMNEAEAREHAKKTGAKLLVGSMPMAWMARALEMGESRGMMKAIVDAESGQILGASVLGVDGGEVAAQIQLAMMGKLPYTALRDGVFSHPTRSEALNTLFTDLKPLD